MADGDRTRFPDEEDRTGHAIDAALRTSAGGLPRAEVPQG